MAKKYKDLAHVILQFESMRVTIFPTVYETGDIHWHGSITMPGVTIALIDFDEDSRRLESKEDALEATLKTLQVIAHNLLGLTKTVMNLVKDKRVGDGS